MYKVVKVQLSSVKLDQEMFCSAFFFICSLKVKLKAWNDNQRIYFLFNEKIKYPATLIICTQIPATLSFDFEVDRPNFNPIKLTYDLLLIS